MKKKREIIDDILDPNYIFEDNFDDEDIITKCLKCGFEEPVPVSFMMNLVKRNFIRRLKR